MKRLETLGELRLVDENDRQLLRERRKDVALVAYLARQRDRASNRPQLAALLWPQADEARSRMSLRRALVDLRGVFGDDVILDDDQVSLSAHALTVDADEFEQDVSSGSLSEAARRWQGDFLQGLEELGDETWRTWIEGERAILRARLAWCLDRLVAASQSEGRWHDAVLWSEQWIAAIPADERGAAGLIRALRSSGRESDAFARHALLRQQLTALNGAEPSAAFIRLGERLRPEAPIRPGSRGLLTPDFVGRELVLRDISTAWSAARRGTGRTVIVEADAGMGKTRLGDEVIRVAKASEPRALVLEGRAFSSESDAAHASVRPLLARLAEAPGLAATAPEVIASLAAVSPAIAERFRHSSSRSTLTVPAALARAVADIAADVPVIIVLDDAPNADTSSQQAMAELVRRTPPHVFVLLSGETAAWTTSPIGADVRSAPHVAHVTLAPLSEEEAREFITSMAPMDDRVARDLARRLNAETSGRPALLHALMMQLAERGLLAVDASGRWQTKVDSEALSLELPSGLREMTLARLRALPEHGRTAYEAAAVIGPRVDPSVLEQVSRLTPNDFQAGVGELLARRLLRSGQQSSGGWEFPGEPERRAVYDLIVPSTRRRLHRSAARALGSTDHPDGRAEARRHRRLGGTSARIRAAVAVSLLVAGGTGALAMFRSGGLLEAGGQVVLATVQDLSGDSLLSPALTEVARIGLQQSSRLRLYSVAQIGDALRRMRRSDTLSVISEDVARQIALRDGLPVVIHLTVARVDSAFVLTGRLIEPGQGQDLSVSRVRVRNRADLLDGMDDLLRRVRRSLGESRMAVRRSEPLPRVTTSSLDALYDYVEGVNLWRRREYGRAREAFDRAVAQDTGFALALGSLGAFYQVILRDQTRGNEYFDRALGREDRLTRREALSLRRQIADSRGPPELSAQLAEELARQFPDRDSWYTLGTTLMRLRRYEEAVVALRSALALDPRYTNAWINIATAEASRERVDAALAAYDSALRTDSLALYGNGITQEWGSNLIRAGRTDAADSVFRRSLAMNTVDAQLTASRALGWLAMYRGQYREAINQFSRAAQVTEQLRASASAYRNNSLAALGALAVGDRSQARRLLDRAEAQVVGQKISSFIPFYGAMAHLGAGDTTGAKAILARLERDQNTALPDDRSAVHLLRAMLLTSHADSAIAEARREDFPPMDGIRDALLSDIYERQGNLDSALAAARRLDSKWQFGWEAQELWVRAPLRIARISLRRADTASAREALERFLTRWKDADSTVVDLRAAGKLYASLPH